MMRFPEKHRICDFDGMVHVPSKPGDRYGYFLIPPSLAAGRMAALRCIASSGDDWHKMEGMHAVPIGSMVPWEHVSVSLLPPMMTRCPTWPEMCYVKSLFWDLEDAVLQLHPPVSEYVNHARFCLHLWRPVGVELPRPPAWCVGDGVGQGRIGRE